jgi:CHAT domain-containing protein
MNPAGSRLHRVRVWLVVFACVAGAALALRRSILRVRAAVALEQAVEYANEQRSVGVPLMGDSGAAARSIAGWLLPPHSALDAAARMIDWDDGETNRTAYAAAIAQLLDGRPQEAIKRLDAIPSTLRNAAVWSNFGAAEIALARVTGAPEHLLGALVDADHAETLDGAASAPYFIRAMALEMLELRRAAAAAWRQYSDRDSSSAWSRVAKTHAAALARATDDRTAWLHATSHIEKLSPSDLAALARKYPQLARTYGEAIYLGEWADAIERSDVRAASASLRQITTIAHALQLSTGESLLADIVASIDAADDEHRHAIARAFLRYRNGRLASDHQDPGSALPHYEEAHRLFSALSSPLAAIADCYAAIALMDLNRNEEAGPRLRALIARERAAGARHQALIGFALYHLALCDAAEGSWSEALAAAEESLSIFSRLRERGFSGTNESLISQCYDFLGQRHLAIAFGTRAVASLTAAGDSRRLGITIGGLSRSALRHGDWEMARVLIEAERLTARTPVPRDDCDTFLRLAAADYHLGYTAESQRALAGARAAAAKTPDGALRQKLLADVDGVAGSLIRRSNPRAAIPMLSTAIEFQTRAERAILLPELYLQRGRANADLGHLGDAAADFEHGITQLERQRTHVSDAVLRAGIFDDAAELFASAVSHAVARDDPAGAFAYVERGRARAIAEEIAVREKQAPPAISVKAITEVLPPDAVIVEYQSVDSGIVIVTLNREGLAAVRVNLPRGTIEAEVQSFVDALAAHGGAQSLDQASAQLFEHLIEPIRRAVARAHTIVIVPDATLQQLPFAALRDPATHRYLIEDHVLATTPSASVFITRARHSTHRDQSPPNALLVANPLLNGGAFAALSSLPGSEAESRHASRAYGASTVVARADATASRFIAAADAYDVVQFAGHTVIRPVEPWHSALLFAPEGGDAGLLTVQRIARLSFRRTRTAVLASCSTLRGHTAGVEGVPSVARAFLLAGVPSIIGTLWDIEDGEAAAIVDTLHEHLAQGAPAADALRTSQLNAIYNRVAELRHPSRWSPFAVLATRETFGW